VWLDILRETRLPEESEYTGKIIRRRYPKGRL